MRKREPTIRFLMYAGRKTAIWGNICGCWQPVACVSDNRFRSRPDRPGEAAYGRLSGEGQKPLLVLLKYPPRPKGAATRCWSQRARLRSMAASTVALVGRGRVLRRPWHSPKICKSSRTNSILRTGVSRTGLSARSARTLRDCDRRNGFFRWRSMTRRLNLVRSPPVMICTQR